MQHDIRRILVQLDLSQKAARDVYGSLMRYASLNPRWDLRLLGGHPMDRNPKRYDKWHPHGLIIDRPPFPAQIRKLLKNGLRAAVLLYNEANADRQFARTAHFHVKCDNRAIGEAGARLLLRRGMRHFAYAPSTVFNASLHERQQAFCHYVALQGYQTVTYKIRKRQFASEDVALANWILSLPKPCGIMADFDHRAKMVIDACRVSNVNVPTQVLVLGVDNEEYICEYMIPTLSSILPDFSGGAFAAAEQLDGLLDGKPMPQNADILYGVRSTIERGSTADVSGKARSVALSCEFIRQHASENISLQDIVRASGTSHRMLERHFREALGHSAAHELQRQRLELVRHELLETSAPIGEIGRKCGFRDESHLKRLFKQETGMSMTDYRNTVVFSNR